MLPSEPSNEYFRSFDNLISHYNTVYGLKYNLSLQYSTPSMYVDAIAQVDAKLPIIYDDMMPYKDETGYWSGFYTSRPQLKQTIR